MTTKKTTTKTGEATKKAAPKAGKLTVSKTASGAIDKLKAGGAAAHGERVDVDNSPNAPSAKNDTSGGQVTFTGVGHMTAATNDTRRGDIW